MRLIVFSDLHGNAYALDAFIKKIAGEEYDYLVFCGDIFGYYYNQKEILEKMVKLNKLIWIKGNHDEFFVRLCRGENEEKYVRAYGHSYENIKDKYDEETVKLISKLPSSYILEDNEKKIAIFHGSPNDELDGRIYPNTDISSCDEFQKYDIVILGHTHHRMIKIIGKTMVINSGSLGQPRDGNGFGYAIVDTGTREVQFSNVQINMTKLYRQIDKYDKNLSKLKEVLER